MLTAGEVECFGKRTWRVPSLFNTASPLTCSHALVTDTSPQLILSGQTFVLVVVLSLRSSTRVAISQAASIAIEPRLAHCAKRLLTLPEALTGVVFKPSECLSTLVTKISWCGNQFSDTITLFYCLYSHFIVTHLIVIRRTLLYLHAFCCTERHLIVTIRILL